MKNVVSSCSNSLPNEAEVDLHVLGALMLDGVGGHVNSADVVALDQSSLTEQCMQLN